jgi:Tfp pilus assembly protein PilF
MRRLGVAALLTAAVLVVFWPVLGHDFVNFDDNRYVTHNPWVQRGLDAASFRWAWTTTSVANWHPLTWLSHMLDWKLFGPAPRGHHATSLVLHTANTVLCFLVFERMTGALWRSALVAALFGLHPLHVESVAWVSERKDVLSTLFWFLASIAYVGYVRRGGARRYVAALVLFVLGLLSKPVVALAPFTWLLLDIWPLGRFAEPKTRASVIVEKLPFVALGIAAMAWTLAAQREIGAVTSPASLPWTFRAGNAVLSYVTYLWKTIWPADLAVFYPYPRELSLAMIALGSAVMIALSVLAWRTARTHPHVATGWWWYVGTLVPMIGLVQVGSHGRADRFTYVPLVGIFVVIAWSLAAFARHGAWRRAVVAVGALAAIVSCATVARAQVETWRTSETLWRHAAAATSANFRAEAGLAEAARRRSDTDAAIAHYQEAVRLAPDAAEFHVNLGLLLVAGNRIEDATAAFQRAVDLRPSDAESHNNLGAMLARQGRLAEAMTHYRRALEISPAYALAQRNLGLALAAGGDLAGGIREVLAALERSPSEAQWHYEVGVMLANVGQTAGAVGHLQDALRLAPQHSGARDALAALGK